MKGLLALLLAGLALGLVAAGCGGDDDDQGGGNGGGGAAETQQQEPAAEDEGGGGGAEVSMESIKFEPATLTIAPGDTVTWTNNDTVGHDVTGDDFKSGGAGAMQNGDTFEHTFEEAGTFDYVCTVHPGMEGTVEVK